MQRRKIRWLVEVPEDSEEQKSVELQISDTKGKFFSNIRPNKCIEKNNIKKLIIYKKTVIRNLISWPIFYVTIIHIFL